MAITKLPVSWKEFVKHPVVAALYLSVFGLVGLYIDGRVSSKAMINNYREQIQKCETENYLQNVKIDRLTEKLQRSDSALNRLASKLETLKELGKIQ